MIHKKLALRLFEASYIQRWNEKIRPVELTELDKHAHKMIIAYCLAKYEELNGEKIEWHSIIKSGIYELLRRVVISDIKSPIFAKIKDEFKSEYDELNKWVFKNLETELTGLAKGSIKEEIFKYLTTEDCFDEKTNAIMKAAHAYASYWEFQIIRQANPHGYQIPEIHKKMINGMVNHLDLIGMRKILTEHKISDFINLCGQLRFQIRWGHTPRIPKTSVLGHMLLVACISYLLAREIDACPMRIYNNFFGGLFHDLPEVVTRDIISPVKNAVEGMPEAISKIERDLAAAEIYPLLEKSWIPEFKYFTENEFEGKIVKDGEVNFVSSDDISESYNDDAFSPIDGKLIEVSDKFSAFLEAYAANAIGIKTSHLQDGLQLHNKFKGTSVAGLSVYELFVDFLG
jgi:putative hydrolase of HD superfamily